MIWHVITRVGDADTFDPQLSPTEPRIVVGLRRAGDPYTLGPDAIKAIAKAVGEAPQDAAADLLTAATAAFAADLRVPRDLAPDRWTRHLRLYVPVTDPTLWSTVAPRLSELLAFLTGDVWEIEFRQLVSVPAPALGSTKPQVKTVCLFSGGLDSLVGGIDLLSTGEPVALVGQYGAGLTNSIQKRVLAPLRDRFGGALHAFMFYVQPSKEYSAGEPTMRSRSILFLALGVVVASALRAKRLVVAENGLISLNVSLTMTRLGSHSTRTTHPHVMAMLSALLQSVGLDVAVELPYRFQTKGEMLAGTKDANLLATVAPLTMSCSHPEVGRYRGTTPGHHCGYCVPCVIRRAALKRAGLAHGVYDVDILTKPPSRASRTADDLRAFDIAIERFRTMSHRGHVAAVLSTGPIPGTDAGRYAEMYARGMEEVDALLSGVPRP